MVPLLCPLSTPNTVSRPSQEHRDLVGSEEVLANESKETEKEKAVTSTSSDGNLQISKPPTSFGHSRSATLVCSLDSSPSPAKPQASEPGGFSIGAFLNTGQPKTRYLPKYMPILQPNRWDAAGLKSLQANNIQPDVL